MLQRTIGNVIIPEVNAVMYVVIGKAYKHVPCGKLVGTFDCLTL